MSAHSCPGLIETRAYITKMTLKEMLMSFGEDCVGLAKDMDKSGRHLYPHERELVKVAATRTIRDITEAVEYNIMHDASIGEQLQDLDSISQSIKEL